MSTMEKRVPGIADKSMKEGYFMKMKRVLSAGLIGAMALSTLSLYRMRSNSGDDPAETPIFLVDILHRRTGSLL